MKEIVNHINAYILATERSCIEYTREYPHLKDLALETNRATPIQKAAFALHYLCCDMEDDQPIPVLAVNGILYYLEKRNHTCERNDLERMYEDLKLAFSNNETAVDIENILEKYMQHTHNQRNPD